MIGSARDLLHEAARVVSFTGAGLSAESGIPTFREAAGDGLWSRYDPMQLASATGFAEDPRRVLDWYAWRRRKLADKVPNPAHVALARSAGLVHVTQNVDDLLERAGATGVVHLHGTLGADRCHAGCEFSETIDLGNPPGPRDCPACGAALRPAVVWFGEALPPDAWHAGEAACLGADALLVVGTSAVVYPAAGLIDVARAAGARIIVVNTQPSGAGDLADIELIGKAGEIVPEILARD